MYAKCPKLQKCLSSPIPSFSPFLSHMNIYFTLILYILNFTFFIYFTFIYDIYLISILNSDIKHTIQITLTNAHPDTKYFHQPRKFPHVLPGRFSPYWEFPNNHWFNIYCHRLFLPILECRVNVSYSVYSFMLGFFHLVL